jgi:hypothetical protein
MQKFGTPSGFLVTAARRKEKRENKFGKSGKTSWDSAVPSSV